MTPSMRSDAAVAWRERDLPSHSRSFLGRWSDVEGLSRVMQFERMRDFLWIKLIGFQQISMWDCAICKIRMAGINEKDGLTPANFCLKRCIRILEIQRGIFLNDSFLRCLWALFLSHGPIYRRRMGLGHNVSDIGSSTRKGHNTEQRDKDWGRRNEWQRVRMYTCL